LEADKRLDAVVRERQLYNIAIYSWGFQQPGGVESIAKDVRHQIKPKGYFTAWDARNGANTANGNIRYRVREPDEFQPVGTENIKDQITGHALSDGRGERGQHIATFGPRVDGEKL